MIIALTPAGKAQAHAVPIMRHDVTENGEWTGECCDVPLGYRCAHGYALIEVRPEALPLHPSPPSRLVHG